MGFRDQIGQFWNILNLIDISPNFKNADCILSFIFFIIVKIINYSWCVNKYIVIIVHVKWFHIDHKFTSKWSVKGREKIKWNLLSSLWCKNTIEFIASASVHKTKPTYGSDYISFFVILIGDSNIQCITWYTLYNSHYLNHRHQMPKSGWQIACACACACAVSFSRYILDSFLHISLPFHFFL